MIAVVDFGSQTAHLIARRLRDLGISSQIIDPEEALPSIRQSKPKGLIFSGGPTSVYEPGAPTIDTNVFELGIPILGICYGWQLTARLLGGQVRSGHKEYGPASLSITQAKPLFSGIGSQSQVWVSHGDSVIDMPPGFQVLAATESVRYAAAANLSRQVFGVQFHPEVEHTTHGTRVLKNFAISICGLQPRRRPVAIDPLLTSIRKTVGKTGNVICAVSGGVDSTVTATLLVKAVDDRLHPIYVESGLMRRDAGADVVRICRDHLGIKPVIVHAEKLFLKHLAGVTDAETKRRIIGRLYIDIFTREAKKIKNVKFLAQGTIYSDVIESKGTKKADKIKSHHNVGGLPETMHLKLIEPLRNLYKDEVRQLGLHLGLPPEFIHKQVFPGPGQAVRIIGEVTPERLAMQHQADEIILEEIRRAGLYKTVYMSFPVMTNTVSTAVKGDSRQLLEVAALRIIESSDVMTTTWARVPYDLLQRISTRIVNEVPQISRVVYDITTKPPATMEWE